LLADGTAHPRAVNPETSRLRSDRSPDPHVRLVLEDHLEFDRLALVVGKREAKAKDARVDKFGGREDNQGSREDVVAVTLKKCR